MSLVCIDNDSFKKERKVVASLIFLYTIKLSFMNEGKVEFHRYQNRGFLPTGFH